MRIQVVAIGRVKAGPERELIERYRTRAVALGRGLGFGGPDLVEIPESRRRSAPERQAEEAAALRAKAGDGELVVLDERAPAPDSAAFADRLRLLGEGGRSCALVIGGADGLAPDLRARAAWSLSFGRLTLPHQLVRVLLLEQVYRAFTILAGHPYHRTGADDA